MSTTNEIDRAVGSNLKALRERSSYSRASLAQRAGLATTDLEAAEAGRVRLRATELFQLSQALGVPVGDFYTGIVKKLPLDATLVGVDGE